MVNHTKEWRRPAARGERSMIFSHGVKLAGTASLLALSALGAAAPALAQDAADAVSAPTGLNDIVETAQKREQSLQELPVSIVWFSGWQIEGMTLSHCRSHPDNVSHLYVPTQR